MSEKSKKLIVIALVILIALAAAAWFILGPKAQAGSKTVDISIVHADGSVKDFIALTEAETLRGVLDEIDLAQGEDGPYGLYVLTVDGETVDEGNEEWWCFTKGGEMLMTGVDDTMIADGDKYEITFTVGYDMG